MNHPDSHDEHQEGALVLPFPGARGEPEPPEPEPGAELEPASEVLDAEIVSEEEYTRRKTLPVMRRPVRWCGSWPRLPPRPGRLWRPGPRCGPG